MLRVSGWVLMGVDWSWVLEVIQGTSITLLPSSSTSALVLIISSKRCCRSP